MHLWLASILSHFEYAAKEQEVKVSVAFLWEVGAACRDLPFYLVTPTTKTMLRAQSRILSAASRRAVPAAAAGLRCYATAAGSGELLSDKKAAENDNRWKGTSTNGSGTKLYIDGEWIGSTTRSWIDLHDPVSPSSASSLRVFYYGHAIAHISLDPSITPASLTAIPHASLPQSSQKVLTKVPESTQAEMTRAVDAAEQAFQGGWGDSSVLSRQRIMMK